MQEVVLEVNLSPKPSHPRFVDLTGQRFGRLVVIGYAGRTPGRAGAAYWLCKCDCGGQSVAIVANLRNGSTKSCGCLSRELLSLRSKKHGLSSVLGYKSYAHMVARCYDKDHRQYKNYGARGIAVCERWLESVENFLVDMGPKPSPNHSLDRIDNNLGYSKENCRWATRVEQSRNRRITRMAIYKGTVMPFAAALEVAGIVLLPQEYKK